MREYWQRRNPRTEAAVRQILTLDGGRFLLESHLDIVADHVRRFLGRTDL